MDLGLNTDSESVRLDGELDKVATDQDEKKLKYKRVQLAVRKCST